MTDIYTFFENTSKALDLMRSRLGEINAQMQGFHSRLGTASAQIKRNLPLRDDTLETDFNSMSKNLYDFANETEEFWTQTRESLRSFNKKEIAENYSFDVKSFNIKSRVLTRSMDEVSTTFGYVYPAAKNSTLKLNTWMLEAATLSMDKIASKILFMARELSKIIETRGSKNYY